MLKILLLSVSVAMFYYNVVLLAKRRYLSYWSAHQMTLKPPPRQGQELGFGAAFHEGLWLLSCILSGIYGI